MPSGALSLSFAAIVHFSITGEFDYDDAFSNPDPGFALLSGSFSWDDQSGSVFNFAVTTTHYCDGADPGCNPMYSAQGGGWTSSFVASAPGAGSFSGPDGDLAVDRTTSMYTEDDGLGVIVFDAFQRYVGTDGLDNNSGGPETMTETFFVGGSPVVLNGLYETAVIPLPAAVWLFASGLLGLAGSRLARTASKSHEAI